MSERAANLRAKAELLSSPWPPLFLAARRLAASLTLGLHGRRRTGRGESFWQYRHYQWGDPARTIDWRQSARSDDVYIRETEWSVAASLWIWIDTGPSMDWRSSEQLPTKAERAALLALSIAALAAQAGEQVTLAGMDAAPSAHESNLVRMAEALTVAKPKPRPTPDQIPQNAEVILFSDFESPLEEIESNLSLLAEKRAQVTLVHVADPAEEQLPYDGHILFSDPARPLAVRVPDAKALKPDYQAKRAAHKAGLVDLAKKRGWWLHSHSTDRPASTALLALHAGLSTEQA